MRPFKDLIKEIEVGGKKFVPIVEIAKLLGLWEPQDIQGTITKGCEQINVTFASENERYELRIIDEYSFNLYNITFGEYECFVGQLQIFQALTKWGFIHVPFNMPSDEQIAEYILNMRQTAAEIKQMRLFDVVKQALQYFINKKEGE